MGMHWEPIGSDLLKLNGVTRGCPYESQLGSTGTKHNQTNTTPINNTQCEDPVGSQNPPGQIYNGHVGSCIGCCHCATMRQQQQIQKHNAQTRGATHTSRQQPCNMYPVQPAQAPQQQTEGQQHHKDTPQHHSRRGINKPAPPPRHNSEGRLPCPESNALQHHKDKPQHQDRKGNK